jgi:hypothetical protein
VRNADNGGVEVEVFGIRVTLWSGPDGESLTGETRWLNVKPSLTVTEGDEALFRQLERSVDFWKANVGGLSLAGTTDETATTQ